MYHVSLGFGSVLSRALPVLLLPQGDYTVQAVPGSPVGSDPPTPALPSSLTAGLDAVSHAFHQMHMTATAGMGGTSSSHAGGHDALGAGHGGLASSAAKERLPGMTLGAMCMCSFLSAKVDSG